MDDIEKGRSDVFGRGIPKAGRFDSFGRNSQPAAKEAGQAPKTVRPAGIKEAAGRPNFGKADGGDQDLGKSFKDTEEEGVTTLPKKEDVDEKTVTKADMEELSKCLKSFHKMVKSMSELR